MGHPKWQGPRLTQSAQPVQARLAITAGSQSAASDYKGLYESKYHPILSPTQQWPGLRIARANGQNQKDGIFPDAVITWQRSDSIKTINPLNSAANSMYDLQPVQLVRRSKQTTPEPKRLDFYAYSFWRGSASPNSNAPAAQYGGSQSGVVATYRLTKAGQPEVAVLARAAVTPGAFADQEMAMGLRWRPIPKLPISVSAERRLRAQSPDQFALYAAGSIEDVDLPKDVKVRGFAQAGITRTSKLDFFYDAGVRAERRLVKISNTELFAGAGAWTGGQRGATRLDLGPTVRSELNIGAARVSLSADWRFRVGGNAGPSNGPAITVATGF